MLLKVLSSIKKYSVLRVLSTIQTAPYRIMYIKTKFARNTKISTQNKNKNKNQHAIPKYVPIPKFGI